MCAIIAEGVPERDAKQLIAYARANNKVIIGPATVGGAHTHRAGFRRAREVGFDRARMAAAITIAQIAVIAGF